MYSCKVLFICTRKKLVHSLERGINVADVLLLEPGYSNKYPPIGLMKISYFHKYIHHDYVRFAKGKLPET